MTVTVDLDNAVRQPRGYDAKQMGAIAGQIVRSKRVLCLAGAGISTSSGIPDFRSKDGLYQLAASGRGTAAPASDASTSSTSSSRSTSTLVSSTSTTSSSSESDRYKGSGQDMFSTAVFQSSTTLNRFYRFIAGLHHLSKDAQPSDTHDFLSLLSRKKKLLRVYTQNIDGLEEKVGLKPVARASCAADDNGSTAAGNSKGKGRSRAVKDRFEGNLVQLHGRAASVRCTVCPYVGAWTDDIDQAFCEGQTLPCRECEERLDVRRISGRRSIAVGALRPNITLYGEQGKDDALIAEVSDLDMRGRPDCLIVMGTSLKVHGFKNLVKDFAFQVHERGGHVVYVNLSAPSKEWQDHFDYYVPASTDDFAKWVTAEWRRILPKDWQKQTLLSSAIGMDVVKSKVVASGKPSDPLESTRTPTKATKISKGTPKPKADSASDSQWSSATPVMHEGQRKRAGIVTSSGPKLQRSARTLVHDAHEAEQEEATLDSDSDKTLVSWNSDRSVRPTSPAKVLLASPRIVSPSKTKTNLSTGVKRRLTFSDGEQETPDSDLKSRKRAGIANRSYVLAEEEDCVDVVSSPSRATKAMMGSARKQQQDTAGTAGRGEQGGRVDGTRLRAGAGEISQNSHGEECPDPDGQDKRSASSSGLLGSLPVTSSPLKTATPAKGKKTIRQYVGTSSDDSDDRNQKTSLLRNRIEAFQYRQDRIKGAVEEVTAVQAAGGKTSRKHGNVDWKALCS